MLYYISQYKNRKCAKVVSNAPIWASNFPGGGPPNPPSGSRRPPPTPIPTCHYMARNGGRVAILVPLTLEKVPVTKNLNKNPDIRPFFTRTF